MNKLIYSVLATALAASSLTAAAENGFVAAAESYGYHLDFARKMHALDMAALAQQGYAERLAADEYDALRYQVDFGQAGYSDAYGNQYSGSFEYRATHNSDQVGTTHRMHFNDFKINQVGIRGSKVSVIRTMEDDETASSCWGRSCKSITASAKQDEALSFTFADGSSVTHDGALTKTLAYDDHGQRYAEISGSFIVADANGVYHLDLTEAVTMNGHCRWPQAGAVQITNASEGSARVQYGVEDSCSASVQVSSNGGSSLQTANPQRYWQ